MDITTKIALSMALVIALAMGGCVSEFSEPLPPRDALYYPIGMEMHPNGRFLYVVNSNFDLRYREEMGGTVSVIDTESGEILGGASPYIPSFGGHIELNADATKAYVTSRQGNEVTVLTVAEQGQALYCEVDGVPRANTEACRMRRVPDISGGARVPPDPFGIAVGQAQRTVGGEEINFDVVYLSHLRGDRRGDQVTAITLPEGDEIAGASMRSATLLAGNKITRRPGSQDVYVAGRNTNRVGIFRPFINDVGEVEGIINRGSIELSRRQETVDARGLDFDRDGDWLYVATRQPNMLHMVGMEAGPDRTPRVVTSIPLEIRPSEVVSHMGADGVQRIYVPSYRYGIIQVIDAEQEAVVDVIDVGRSPYHLVMQEAPRNCQAPGERCLGYVSLFDARDDRERRCREDDRSCGKIAVLDLDPASETFHTVIDTID